MAEPDIIHHGHPIGTGVAGVAACSADLHPGLEVRWTMDWGQVTCQPCLRSQTKQQWEAQMAAAADTYEDPAVVAERRWAIDAATRLYAGSGIPASLRDATMRTADAFIAYIHNTQGETQ